MRKILNILFILTLVSSAKADWGLQLIKKSSGNVSTRYDYCLNSDMVFFREIGIDPPDILYRYDIQNDIVDDSLTLASFVDNLELETGLFEYDGSIYISGSLSILEQEMIFKINSNDFTDVDEVHAYHDSIFRNAFPVVDGGFTLTTLKYKDSLRLFYSYKSLSHTTIFYLDPWPQYIEIQTTNNRRHKWPYFITDNLIFTYINIANKERRYWQLLQNNNEVNGLTKIFDTSKNISVQPIEDGYFVLPSKNIVYKTDYHSSTDQTSLYYYAVSTPYYQPFPSYFSRTNSITNSGQNGFILTMNYGDIIDSEVSTESPFTSLDTTNIHPLYTEKISNGDYFVFAYEGVFRLKSNTSIIEEKESPQITPSAIYDLTGRTVYIGEDAESTLRTLTRGTYIIMVDGKGELRRVE